jgi:hypothetical protein
LILTPATVVRSLRPAACLLAVFTACVVAVWAALASIEENPDVPVGYAAWYTNSGTNVVIAFARTSGGYWFRVDLNCPTVSQNFAGLTTFPVRIRAQQADQYYYKITGRPTGFTVWPDGANQCQNSTGASTQYDMAAQATHVVAINLGKTPAQNIDGEILIQPWADTFGTNDTSFATASVPARTDVTAPSEPTVTLSNWGSTSVTYTVSASDGRSGLYGVRPQFDGSVVSGGDGYFGSFKTQREFSKSGLTPGSLHSIDVEAFDMLGNKSSTSLSFYTSPSAFGKGSPATNTTGLSTSPSLSWGSSTGAASYEYCVDTTDDGACGSSWTSTGSFLNAQPSGLAGGTPHFWQVRAVNIGGTTYADNGTWWRFTTQANPPGTFNKSAPSDQAQDQSTSPALSWGSSSGAASYEYCVDTTNDGACGGSWTSTGTARNAQPSGLAAGTPHFWQVRAVSAGGTTYANNGTWWRFTTQAAPPGTFNKSAPSDLAPDQSTSPALSWGSSSGAASYEYCVDTTNDSACGGSWTSTGTVRNAQPSGLVAGTQHFWQVRAVNDGGTTYANSGTWWRFTTQSTPPPAPGQFGKSAPADQAADQSTSPALSWGASSGVASYEYCVDTTNDGACGGSWTSTGSVPNAQPSGLAAGTTHFWQVRALNGGGTTYADNGTWWRFTTQSTLPPIPGQFGKSAPTNGAPNQLANLTLSWGQSSGALGYEFCYDTSDDSACTGWQPTGASRTASLTNLQPGTQYYWQVRAYIEDSVYADGGAWWSFTTQDGAGLPDTCQSATVVSATPYSHSVQTSAATSSGDDPSPSCGNGSSGKSIWYRFTAPSNGTITANTFGSSYDTILAAFAGACGALNQVSNACNDDSDGLQSRISFTAVGGTTYYFMVSAYSNDGGTLNFALDFTGLNFVLTVSKRGTGSGTISATGINCGADCQESIAAGTAATLSATPDSGSAFSRWGGDSDCSDGSVVMSANRSCVATFNADFTDHGLPAFTVVRAVHLTELRSRIAAVRSRLGLASFAFTDTSLTGQVTEIRAQHILELRSAISEASQAAGLAPLVFTDPLLAAGTIIRAVHINELRAALFAIE